mgnify:CR=1 FL=1
MVKTRTRLDTIDPTTGNLSQKGSTSSNQGQEVGHTDFPLYVYIVKTHQGA